MKRVNPFYILAFMSGYFLGSMAFMLAIPASSESPRLVASQPVNLMRAAWPFHRDKCVKRTEADGFSGYIYDRKLYFGTREACESYQNDQKHPAPPSAHHWTPTDEGGTKPLIATCNSTNMATCAVTVCTKDGETNCVDVVCYGRNLVEGCPGWEPPALPEDEGMSAMSIVVAKSLCDARPQSSVWVRLDDRWAIVPCDQFSSLVDKVLGVSGKKI